MRLSSALAVVVIPCALLGCADATAPRLVHPPAVRLTVDPPHDTTITIVHGGAGITTVASGPSDTIPTMFHVTMSGSVSIAYTNTDNIVVPWPVTAPVGGTTFTMTPTGCWGTLVFHVVDGGSIVAPCDAGSADGYIVIGSSGSYAQRQDWPENGCNKDGTYQNCETFSGTDVISLSWVQASYGLTSSAAVIAPGGGVTFTGSFNPDTVAGGIRVPRQGPIWMWVPDDSTSPTIPCNWFDVTCTYHPSSSGTMLYGGTANGHPDTAKAYVYLRRCRVDSTPADTSPLDSVIVRKTLMQLVQEGKGLTTDTANRKEHVMAFLLDTGTHQIVVYPMTLTDSTACSSSWNPLNPAAFPGTQLLAMAHVHPWTVGDHPGSLCGWNPSYRVAPGGSTDDWQSIDTINNLSAYSSAGWHPDFYVIDNENVYEMRHGGTYGDDKVPVMAWRQGTCRW